MQFLTFLNSFLLTPAMLVVVTEPRRTLGGTSKISLRCSSQEDRREQLTSGSVTRRRR